MTSPTCNTGARIGVASAQAVLEAPMTFLEEVDPGPLIMECQDCCLWPAAGKTRHNFSWSFGEQLGDPGSTPTPTVDPRISELDGIDPSSDKVLFGSYAL